MSDLNAGANRSFRQRAVAGEQLFGTFLKIPTSHNAEMMGTLGFDFVILDQEHGMFDRTGTDMAILGARSAGCVPLVRVPSADPAGILQVLDMGAQGIIVPHVGDAAQARAIVDASRYRAGSRGFSGLSRSGQWGARKTWEHIDISDELVMTWAIIEDAAGVENIEEIAAVDGLDGIFLGRADLTVALGETGKDSPVVQAALQRIVKAAKANNKPLCTTASKAEAEFLAGLGVRVLVLSSDQAFLRAASSKALAEYPRA